MTACCGPDSARRHCASELWTEFNLLEAARGPASAKASGRMIHQQTMEQGRRDATAGTPRTPTPTALFRVACAERR